MARTLLVLDEVVALLRAADASEPTIRRFEKQIDLFMRGKGRGQAPDGADAVTVSSGFGQTSQRGFVELTINDVLTQMETKKAREVGLMILQAAEAAESDELFMKWLESDVGVSDPERRGRMLYRLRELRQGTRGIAWPS